MNARTSAAGLGAVLAGFALGFPALAAAPSPPRAQGDAVPALPPNAVRAALAGDGNPVRQEPGLIVERVSLPSRLRAAHPHLASSIWRVTVAGRYPARPLRYVVLAGGSPIGYGIPAANQRSVRAVTADPAVLTARITARYGDSALSSPPPTIAPLPSPRGSIGTGRALTRATWGPHRVRRAVYDFGDHAFRPSGLGGRVELTADVHYPRGLPGGPYPLVLFMHGSHPSCYLDDSTSFDWPCPGGWKPLPSYTGFDYLARRLASYGFIVVSVSANGVNVLGSELADTGMRQRGELLERHLKLWRKWDKAGGKPFGTRFVGKVDLTEIGTMGHSRGGEGAVWQVIVDRHRRHPYGIDALLALAPVDFTRRTVNRVPLAVVLPYCDGDVANLEGVHFFDDARYRAPGDPSPKHTVTVFGANHNFFNTVWSPGGGPGGDDDRMGACEGPLTQAQERHVGAIYVTSFFRRYLKHKLSQDAMWTGARTPEAIAPARTLVTYLAPDTPSRRLDLDRFTEPGDLSLDELGGSVTALGMSPYDWCPDAVDEPCLPGELRFTDAHWPGLAQGVFGWSGRDAMVRFEIPAGRGDVRRFAALQFRAAVNPGYPASQDIPRQDLVVRLIDGAGQQADVAASEVGNDALAFPSGWGGVEILNGHVILNQVRFPLGRFEGVDLSDIRAVEVRFSRTGSGVIDVADLAFTNGAR